VFFWHSAKKLLCREPFIGRSAKPSLPSAEALPSVFYLALGKVGRSAKKRIPVVTILSRGSLHYFSLFS
jgi:hypothetical protein